MVETLVVVETKSDVVAAAVVLNRLDIFHGFGCRTATAESPARRDLPMVGNRL
jgi:hypothetical protein